MAAQSVTQSQMPFEKKLRSQVWLGNYLRKSDSLGMPSITSSASIARDEVDLVLSQFLPRPWALENPGPGPQDRLKSECRTCDSMEAAQCSSHLK